MRGDEWIFFNTEFCTEQTAQLDGLPLVTQPGACQLSRRQLFHHSHVSSAASTHVT